MTHSTQPAAAMLSVSTYVEALRRSGILSEAQMEDLSSDFEQAEDARQLGAKLIEDGVVTPWQNEKLQEGKWKGYTLGKYVLEGRIGRGGMGRVMLGRHRSLRHQVAVKVLPRNRLKKPAALRRFHREAQMAAQLAHPNVTRTFDADEEEGVHYLVMEYVNGRGIDALVQANGPLSFRDAAEFTRQAAEGLHHAHTHGLIHRDVKPSNLLVSAENVVKILDFGLARSMDDEMDPGITREFNVKMLGTADYLAPEQAVNSHTVDARADIYSLGCTLYYMLTGSAPFPSGKPIERIMKHCTEEPEEIGKQRANTPAGLLQIWQKMTRKRADNRYATAKELAEDLQKWLNSPDDAVSSDDLQLAAKPVADLTPEALQPQLEPLSNLDELPAVDVDTLSSGNLLESVADLPEHTQDVWSTAINDLPSSDQADFDLGPGGDTISNASALMPTSSSLSGEVLKPQAAEATSAVAKKKSGISTSLGEIPLWLCITAGILFGVAIIAVGVSVTSTFFNKPDIQGKGTILQGSE